MLKNEIEKKNQLKNNLEKQPELTSQTFDLGCKTEITSWKINQNK
jgi:hypothetical protein